MLLILDSNEYIFSFGPARDPSCEKLLETIVEHSEHIFLRIPRLIVEEIRNNLTPEAFREFIIFINKLTKIDEDIDIPFELGSRHFLSRQSDLPFKVVTAHNCLKLIHSSPFHT